MFTLSGKQPSGSLEGRTMALHSNKSTTHNSSTLNSTLFYTNNANHNKILLDYILSHMEGDQRPYLKVDVLGYTLLGLLDSGSTATLVGPQGYEILQHLGLKLDKNFQVDCTVANGQLCRTIGIVQTPFNLLGRIRIVKVHVVPELSSTLILGMDFWSSMDLVPDMKRGVWHFGTETDIHVAGIQAHSTLTENQHRQLETLLENKFNQMGNGLGYTTVTEHEIILEPSTTPIKQRYYPVAPFKQKIIDEELKKMLEMDVVEPSKSAWSSPVLLVPKDDNQYRFCVDYRALNRVTKKDAYPLPYIAAILDRLKGARYLSSMDIKSAYWQVPVKPSSREYTAFTVPGRGLFQFKRMPFGLTNAPATWQRLIDQVLGVDLEEYVLVYLDDIIIISPDFETHLDVLEKVFDRLTRAGLTVSREKCKFCMPSLRYLGYFVDSRGLRVDIDKVKAILDIPPPQNPKEVRSFLGIAGWYRRFVKDFSTIIAPLTRLTQKNVKFIWTEECNKSFELIKNQLVSAPILTCPDFSKPFVLQTDASAFGIGAVLTQQFEDGEKVISYLSRSLTRSERNYSTTERECLSVIWAVEKLRYYLEGTQFTVITDHASLVWLHNLKDPSGRLARWAVRLQPFNFRIIHRKGKENIVPDYLSRSVPVSIDVVDVANQFEDFKNTTDKWYKKMLRQVENTPDKFPQWRIEHDLLYKYVRCNLPELAEEADYWKIIVPKDKRKALISKHHDDVRSGHVGSYKTYWRIHNHYFWPMMRADVTKYVKNCRTCAQYKLEQKSPAGLMGRRPNIERPWQMISLDFMGPFPRSKNGYTHLLVISDYFSKYTLLYPFRSATSQALARCVEDNIFCVYGVPEILICDNGKQMKGKYFQDLCSRYNTRINYTANYHPRADPVERYNKTIKIMMSSYVGKNHRKWDENLPSIGCAIRTCRSETTGFTPFFINFGREYIADGMEYKYLLTETTNENPPEDTQKRLKGFRKLFQRVKNKIRMAQQRNERVFNLRRRAVHYGVGDIVWKRNKVLSDAIKNISAKLCPKYVGPCTIIKKHGNWTYELIDENGKNLGIWHVQDVKPVNFQEDEV